MTKKRATRTWAWLGAGVVLATAGLAVVFVIGLPGCSDQESAAQAPSGKQSGSHAVSAAADQPVRVKVVHPTREHLKRVSTPQPAHVEPYEKTEIHAMVSGYLQMIAPALGPDRKPLLEKDGEPRSLDIGDRVKKDQVLAVVAVPQMKQELVQRAALVEKAQADLGQATAVVQAARAQIEETRSLLAQHDADVTYHKLEYDRFLDLFKREGVEGRVVEREEKLLRRAEAARAAAEKAIATAEKNVKVKQADEKAAEARLKVAETDLKYTEIMVDYATVKAPYDGVITRRLVDTGAFIQSATTGRVTPLFTLARVDRLRIVSQIPPAEAILIKVGQRASFQVKGSHHQPVAGKVVRLADALEGETRNMRIEVELDDPPPTLRPGMYGSSTFTLADIADAVTLPASALSAGGKPSVLTVEADRVVRREVEIGYNDGVRMQVTQGLTGAANVIADGKSTVREGQIVAIAP